MANVKKKEQEKENFNFEVPLEPVEQIEPLTSESIEKKIVEEQGPVEPKKRGRKPGSTNKKSDAEVLVYVKVMFGPLVIGVHNTLCKILKLSMLDKEQEKVVTEGYAMLLHKRIPAIIESQGDIIAALGATAFVFGAKLSTETKLFTFEKENKENGKAEQHNNDIRPEGFREN